MFLSDLRYKENLFQRSGDIVTLFPGKWRNQGRRIEFFYHQDFFGGEKGGESKKKSKRK